MAIYSWCKCPKCSSLMMYHEPCVKCGYITPDMIVRVIK